MSIRNSIILPIVIYYCYGYYTCILSSTSHTVISDVFENEKFHINICYFETIIMDAIKTKMNNHHIFNNKKDWLTGQIFSQRVLTSRYTTLCDVHDDMLSVLRKTWQSRKSSLFLLVSASRKHLIAYECFFFLGHLLKYWISLVTKYENLNLNLR